MKNKLNGSNVDEIVKEIMTIDLKDRNSIEELKIGAENFGVGVQKEAFKNNDILKQPLKKLSDKGEHGKAVSDALMDLKEQIQFLDPTKVDFSKKGWLISKFYNPAKKYFRKYEKADAVVNTIVDTLDKSATVLTRDNSFLKDSMNNLIDNTEELECAITNAIKLDEKLSEEISNCDDEDKKNFLKEEVLFQIRQRTTDLQQQLLLNQQGITATNLIINNNKELVKGVTRAKNVTVVALNQSIVLANALAEQKETIDKITGLNDMTSNMILNTSKMIGANGAQIQIQASGAMLDSDKLKQSFIELNKAIDEVDKYKQDILPKMAETIEEYNRLAYDGEKSINKISYGEAIEVEVV